MPEPQLVPQRPPPAPERQLSSGATLRHEGPRGRKGWRGKGPSPVTGWPHTIYSGTRRESKGQTCHLKVIESSDQTGLG